jgi:hypothetical protein
MPAAVKCGARDCPLRATSSWALYVFTAAMTTFSPPSSAALEELVARFRARTLPHVEWTHQAHLCVAAWHVDRLGAAQALVWLREGIRRLNDAHGTPNSPTRGYHETVTVAYVQLIAAFLAARPPEPFATRAAALLASPLAHKEVLLGYYTRERLFSPDARAAWLPPDLQPLPPA